MCNKFIQLLLLFAYLFLACECLGVGDVDSSTPSTDLMDLSTQLREGFATGPECYLSSSDINAYITILSGLFEMGVAAVKAIKAGRLIPEPMSTAAVAAGVSLLITAISTLFSFIYASIAPMCIFSFVRNPIQHYSDYVRPGHPDYAHRGKMKKRLSPLDALVVRYGPTNNHWEAEPAPKSDKLYFCLRFPMVLSFGIGAMCNGGNKWDSDKDLYRGRKSLLCPEEWQNLGVDFELKKNDSGAIEQRVKRKNDDLVFMDPALYNSGVRWVKENSAWVECKGPFSKKATANAHGYTYKVTDGGEAGSKMCVWLVGLGPIPLSTSLLIGCHMRQTIKALPKCPASLPIREDGDWDDEKGALVPDTGTGRIIDYDNSACLSCTVSASCLGKGDMSVHHALVPILSVALRCAFESVSAQVHGCTLKDGSSNVVPSKLAAVQQRLGRVVAAIMSLAIACMGIGILLGSGAQVSQRDVIGILLKMTFVLWCTSTDSSGHGGMQQLGDLGWSIASALTLGAANGMNNVTRGLCHYDDSMYKITGENGEVRDYSWLKPWDMLDCLNAQNFLFFAMPASVAESAGGGTPVVSAPFFFKIFVFALAAFLTAPVFWLMVLFLMIGTIVLFAISVWTTQMIIMTYVVYNVLQLISPIILPSLFFSYTKFAFDGWLKEFYSCIMIYFILTTSVLIMFGTVYVVFWRETSWIGKEVYIFNKKAYYFFVEPTSSCSASTSTDFQQGEVPCGCDRGALGCWLSGLVFKEKSMIFGLRGTGVEIHDATKSTGDATVDALTLALVAFLIYTFYTTLLTSIVVELGGSQEVFEMSDAAMDTKGFMGKVTAAATAPISKAFGTLPGRTIHQPKSGGGDDGGAAADGGDKSKKDSDNLQAGRRGGAGT